MQIFQSSAIFGCRSLFIMSQVEGWGQAMAMTRGEGDALGRTERAIKRGVKLKTTTSTGPANVFWQQCARREIMAKHIATFLYDNKIQVYCQASQPASPNPGPSRSSAQSKSKFTVVRAKQLAQPGENCAEKNTE